MRCYLLFFLIAFMQISVYSQNCGSADTLLIQASSNTTLDFTVADYFNDDLTDPLQGLCDIEIHFVHFKVEDFELSLTSPSGQTVGLTGPILTTAAPQTPFARWKIHFIPCGETADPDPGFLPQWDNDQANDFVAGGQYSGLYYPANGCLEDFNTGNVNGVWTFNFDNTNSQSQGAITYIRLIFCDSRGVDCCFAQAGEIDDADILTCEGDSSLIFDPILSNITLNTIDTIDYDYLFAIIQDSLIINYDTTVNLINYPAGHYEVCGLSFRASELDSLPPADSTFNIDSLRLNLNGLEPWFCGELTDDCIDIQIVAPPDTTFLNHRICQGDSILIGDTSLVLTGIHHVLLANYAGCDSVVTLNLVVEDIPVIALDSTICFGDSVKVGSSVYDESGFYIDTLQTVNLGCDSIINTQVTVIQTITNNISASICQGDSYVVGDSIFTSTGMYSVSLTSALFCDSIVNLTLSVLDPMAVIAPPDTINCIQSQIFLNGSNSMPLGTLAYEWFNLQEELLGEDLLLSVSTADTFILQVLETENMTTCTHRDTIITLSFLETPIADAGLTDTLTCNQLTTILGGSNTSVGNNISYNWQTTDGNFTSASNIFSPSVDSEGSYTLIVSNTINGCADTSAVTIQIDTISPIAEAGNGFVINCNTTPGALSGAGSSLGTNIDYLWTGDCVDTDASQIDIVVSCAGEYFFTVTNTENGCASTDNVEVTGNTSAPTALIATPDTLTCDNIAVILDANASTPLNAVSFEWQGIDIIDGANTATPTVNLAEAYTLIVTDTNNFCADTSIIQVIIDTIPPIADAGIPDTLNCFISQVNIGGSNTSIGGNFSYNWISANGHFISNTTSPTAIIDSAALYQLTVTNTDNGCQSFSSVQITPNYSTPYAQAGDSTSFRCGDNFIPIDGSISVLTPNSIIEWSGPCIETSPDELIIDISCGGTYFLSIIDTESGCESQDFVTVGVNPAALFAHLPDTAYISCETGDVLLDGSMTSLGIYQWFHNDTLINLTGSTPTVQDTGTYQLIVSNLIETCLDTAVIEVLSFCDIEILLVNEPDIITCGESFSTITVDVLPAGPVYEYFWIAPAPNCINSGQGTASIQVLCAGNYTIIVNNSSLGISDTLEIRIDADEDVPLAEAGPSDTLTCLQTNVFLDGSASSIDFGITYTWTNLLGDIVGNQIIIEVTEPGTYILEVSDTVNGCNSFDAVNVLADNIIPQITLGASVFLCESDTFALESFVNPMDDDYVYTWTGEGIIGTDTSTVLIDTIGTFILEVLDLSSGCTAMDTALVTHQVCLPCIAILLPDTLNCETDSLFLTGFFCEECIDCTVEWTTSDGEILSGNDNLVATVAAIGTYTLTVTDMFGFTNTAMIELIGDFEAPDVFAGDDGVINCIESAVILGSEDTATGDEYQYTWSAQNGSPTLPDNEIFTTINTPDTYILSVFDTTNGCFSQDTVLVSIDTIPPVSAAGNNTILSCDTPFLTLDGTGSTLGDAITYLWEIDNNEDCITGDTLLNPIINCPGIYVLTVVDTLNGCQDTSSVFVDSSEDIPMINPISDDTLNCQTTTILLTGNVVDISLFNYQWCPLDQNGDPITEACESVLAIEVDTMGAYQFHVENIATGCDNSWTVLISQDTMPPIIDAGINDTLYCNQDSLLLNGLITSPNDFSSLWSANLGQNISQPSELSTTIYEAGTYFLTTTNSQNFCTAVDSVLIIENTALPEINAGNDTILNCLITQIELNGTATSDNPLSFVWTTPTGNIISGDSTATAIINEAGTYFLSILDEQNNCSSTDSLIVTESIEPPSAEVANLNGLFLNCSQDTLLIDGTPSFSANGNDLLFEWQSFGGGMLWSDLNNDTVWTASPADYRLIVTDDVNFCKDSLGFSIIGDFEEPTISYISPTSLTCDTLMSIIDASAIDTLGMQIFWTDEEGSILAENDLILSVDASDIYILHLLNENNGCENAEDIFVPIDTLMPTAVIAQVIEFLSCQLQEIPLDGSNSSTGFPYEHHWTANPGLINSGEDSTIVMIGNFGTYTLTVVNTENGCEKTAAISIAETVSLVTGALISTNHPNCQNTEGGSITIDSIIGGTPPYLYSINDSPLSTNTFYPNLDPGLYTLYIQDVMGCDWTEENIIIQAEEALILDLGPDITLTLGDSIRLEALINRPYVSLLWSPEDDFEDPTSAIQFLQAQATIAYHVMVTDENGCTATDVILVNVVKPRQFFIPNVFSPVNKDGNNDVFMIFGSPEVKEILNFQIYDRWGNQVHDHKNFQPNNPTFGWDGTLNGKMMNSAVFAYYVEIEFIDGWIEKVKGDVILIR